MLWKEGFCIVVFFICLQVGLLHGQSQTGIELSAKAGFRFEDMDWSIAGNLEGKNPNIKSELRWSDLVIADFSLAGQLHFAKHIFVKAGGSFGRTISGKVSDKDFGGDNRNNVIYDLTIESNEGSDHMYFAHAGYSFQPSSLFVISPMIGYRQSSHTYWLRNELVEIGGEKLNSSYANTWKGPYLGINLELRPTGKFNFRTELSYQQLNYEAKANWNLMNYFAHPVSFKHSAKGFQLMASLSPEIAIGSNFKTFLDMGYAYSNTADGNDLAFFEDGSQQYTRLNEVTRSYWHARLGLRYALQIQR